MCMPFAARVAPAKKSLASLAPDDIRKFVQDLVGDDAHATRVLSLANGVVGVLHSAALGVHAIGRGLADAMALNPKHAIKQVDRLLSNQGFTVWDWFEQWVLFVLADRKEVVVALDWTEFDADDHSTISLYLVTSHGRATPLIWKTVEKSALKNRRGSYELEVLQRLHEIMPTNIDITVLADRGFGDQKLFAHLDTIGWGFAIRFKESTIVTHNDKSLPSAQWVPRSGHAKMLTDVTISMKRTPLKAVVFKHQKNMKQSWCIATNRLDLGAAGVIRLYARRFTIEETFRDLKDNHFGMGLSATHIGQAARRDRLLFLAAVSHALLSLLGAAGEACGLSRSLQANTAKTRQLSLFRQGVLWYRAIGTMKEDRLRLLMDSFAEVLLAHAAFRDVFGII